MSLVSVNDGGRFLIHVRVVVVADGAAVSVVMISFTYELGIRGGLCRIYEQQYPRLLFIAIALYETMFFCSSFVSLLQLVAARLWRELLGR